METILNKYFIEFEAKSQLHPLEAGNEVVQIFSIKNCYSNTI